MSVNGTFSPARTVNVGLVAHVGALERDRAREAQRVRARDHPHVPSMLRTHGITDP